MSGIGGTHVNIDDGGVALGSALDHILLVDGVLHGLAEIGVLAGLAAVGADVQGDAASGISAGPGGAGGLIQIEAATDRGGTDGVDVAVFQGDNLGAGIGHSPDVNGPDGRRLAPVVLIGFQRDGVAADGGDKLVGAGADGGGLVALFAYFLIIGLADDAACPGGAAIQER